MRTATLMLVLLAACAAPGGELTAARDSWDRIQRMTAHGRPTKRDRRMIRRFTGE